MRIAVFLSFLLCLMGSTLVWALRTRNALQRSSLAQWKLATGVWFFAGLQLAGLPALLLLRNGQSEAAHGWSRPVVTILFVWYILGVPLFLFMCSGEFLCRLLLWIRLRFFPKKTSETVWPRPGQLPDAGELAFGGDAAQTGSSGGSAIQAEAVAGGDPAWSLSRRGLFSAALHGAPALLSLGAPALSSRQLEHFRVRKMDVPLADLPEALDGFTITHLSDTHVGRFTHGRILSKIVETTQELNSDLICFTGDLINYSLGDLPPGLEMLQAMKARCGVFLCEGNHDLMHDAAAFRRALERASLRLLADDAAIFQTGNQSVQVFGLPWFGARENGSRRGPEKVAPTHALVSQIQRDAFPILLAHHPHAFDEAGDFRLTLSGHTHGGQLMITPRFGCGPAFYRYWSGLHFRGTRALCVSNGVGNWFPIRVSAPAEIIQLTLRATPPVPASPGTATPAKSSKPAVREVTAASQQRILLSPEDSSRASA